MKKIIKFLDKHRFILILLILLIISILFIGINSFIFLNHRFQKLNCTTKIDDKFCYYKNTKIYINPEEERDNIFKEKETELKALKEKFKLPDFNYYTSYFYEVTSLLNYNETDEEEDIYEFYKNFNASYNIDNFYKENTIYYDLFYRYKINLN